MGEPYVEVWVFLRRKNITTFMRPRYLMKLRNLNVSDELIALSKSQEDTVVKGPSFEGTVVKGPSFGIIFPGFKYFFWGWATKL